MSATTRRRWYLLIHTLPARPLYLRARIRRLVAACGAAPIKKAAYVLPATAAALHALRAVAAEIESGGGSAFVCEATFPHGEEERAVIRAYNEERHRRFQDWMADAKVSGRGSARHEERVARLRRRYEALRAHDCFSAPGAAQAAALMAHLERDLAPRRSRRNPPLTGRTWVTRHGLHVDRLACAWVVRRFVDPAATFRFTATPRAPLAKREIGFDMPGAEITHEEDRCSIETLVARAGISDPAVARMAEIVHDIDLKDARHGYAETAGFERMLVGMLVSTPRDEDRLARGLELFDALYAALSHAGPLPRPSLGRVTERGTRTLPATPMVPRPPLVGRRPPKRK